MIDGIMDNEMKYCYNYSDHNEVNQQSNISVAIVRQSFHKGLL